MSFKPKYLSHPDNGMSKRDIAFEKIISVAGKIPKCWSHQ